MLVSKSMLLQLTGTYVFSVTGYVLLGSFTVSMFACVIRECGLLCDNNYVLI